MSGTTKREVVAEAWEKVAPIWNEVESKKKKLVEHAAVLISFAVIVMSIVLYAFNKGYCKVFNLPPDVMSLDMTRLVPLAAQILSIATCGLFYLSSFKADRAMKKNRIDYVRIMWGAFIVSHFFGINNVTAVIGKWWNVILIVSLPLLVEILLYLRRKPKKNYIVPEEMHEIYLEDAVRDVIFSIYYIKYGIFLVVLPLVFAPILGEFSAKAEREYQNCVVQDTMYAVVVDYSDRVLAQQATEENNVLTIDTSSYVYLDKNDLILQYSKYEDVTIGLSNEIEQQSVFADLWIKIKEVLSVPTITDWLMVIITIVYVVATIYICRANISSAKASKEQLEESKREHEENIRIGIMPFLQFEAYSNSDYDFELDIPLYHHDSCDRLGAEILRLTNIGNGAATNIAYSWENKEYGISLSEAFRVNAIKADGDYKVSVVFDGYSKAVDPNKRYVLTMQYDDMRGYTYEQRMLFSFCYDGEKISIAGVDTDAPKYTGVKFIG